MEISPELGSHSSTIDRRTVHRRAISEVLVSSIAPLHGCADGRFVVSAQLPRAHAYFPPVAGRHDPMLLAEVLRQAVIAISHEFLGVPFGHHFTMQALSISVTTSPFPSFTEPADLVVEVGISNAQTLDDGLCAIDVDLTFMHGTSTIAYGSGQARIFAPAAYARLRQPILAIEASHMPIENQAGSDRPGICVLDGCGAAGTWRLRVDPGHPTFFDHPSDHVPGMLILEGFRQAALQQTQNGHNLLATMSARLHRFGELDRETTISIVNDTAPGVHLQCRQDDHLLAEATVTFSPTRS
ncbi:ScbA/BarX family gamma-butyrolactone biosynthesis protein [Gordonia sp. PDNC005]|nr:ScbA/BarX family gamma-butyrolactone biosynthesis protein [Gordonia sp. PDNC005]